MYKLTIDTKKFDRKNKHFLGALDRGWNRTLDKYRDLMVKRSKIVHKYNNRTFTLTKSHVGTVNTKAKTISITNPTFYRKYVVRHYNQNWIQNSINYYRYKLKYDLEKVPNRYYKGR